MFYYAKSSSGGRGCGPRGYFAMFGHNGGIGGRHRWGGHGSRGEGRGGRRRMFDNGELRLILLKLIADQPRHGYDLIREIESLSGGAYAPSPGVVYPTLTLLQDMDLIAEEAGDSARKLFAITTIGSAHLSDNAEAVEAAMAKLAAMSERSERVDGMQVRRALGNLREAVQIRLGREDVSLETLHAVTALIDEAAQKIERL
jgi:DNA-binding PadR family transcriptional regulator